MALRTISDFIFIITIICLMPTSTYFKKINTFSQAYVVIFLMFAEPSSDSIPESRWFPQKEKHWGISHNQD